MKFTYKAKKGPEEIVEGVIEAASQDEAVAKIRDLGLFPVALSLYEKEPPREKKSKKEKAIIKKSHTAVSGGKSGRVTQKHIYLFTKKLKALLKSQEPILRSLYFLENQTDNKEFKKVLQEIIAEVREGRNFSESLAMYPKYFSQLYIGIIKAGEASGKLDYALSQITKHMDKERQLSQKVISSLAYPLVMITVGIGTIIVIITFVIPKLRSLFEDFGDKLPFITKVLLDMSAFCSKYWPALLVLFASALVGLFYTKNAPWQKKILQILKKRIPVVNNIIYNQSLYCFSSALAILLSSGVTLLDSIKVATPLIGDETAKEELAQACQEIVAGNALENSLRNNCKYLPDMFIRMIAVGEASGRLDEILLEMADTYVEEVETATGVVTSLIEPMAILVVGGILSLIIIAVLLPIFEMSMFMQ